MTRGLSLSNPIGPTPTEAARPQTKPDLMFAQVTGVLALATHAGLALDSGLAEDRALNLAFQDVLTSHQVRCLGTGS